MKIYELSARELHDGLREKKFSATEVARAHIDRIEETEPEVRAFVTLTTDMALATAQEVDDRILRGEDLSRLAGIPVALKDNLCTAGVATTCSSKMLRQFVPPYTATVARALLGQGALIMGKTDLD